MVRKCVSDNIYSSQGSSKRINAQREVNDRSSHGRGNPSGKLFGTRQQKEAPKARKKDLDEGIIVSINGDKGFGFIRSSKEDRDYYFNLRDISRSLLEEIDSIASKTNFNGVKLLDGSKESLIFQTGINAEDSLKVD